MNFRHYGLLFDVGDYLTSSNVLTVFSSNNLESISKRVFMALFYLFSFILLTKCVKILYHIK